MLEADGHVVGFNVEVGELVGLVAEGGNVAGDAFRGVGVDGAHWAGVDGPAEDVLVEGAGDCFVFAANFEVDYWVGHRSPFVLTESIGGEIWAVKGEEADSRRE